VPVAGWLPDRVIIVRVILREPRQVAAIFRAHRVNLEVARAITGESDSGPVRRSGGEEVLRVVVGQPLEIAAAGINQVNLRVAVLRVGEGDFGPIRRPCWATLKIYLGKEGRHVQGDACLSAAIHVDDVKIKTQGVFDVVGPGARNESEPRAVRRPGGRDGLRVTVKRVEEFSVVGVDDDQARKLSLETIDENNPLAVRRPRRVIIPDIEKRLVPSDVLQVASVRIHDVNIPRGSERAPGLITVTGESDSPSVEGPVGRDVRPFVAREIDLITAVHVHRINFTVAVALARERDSAVEGERSLWRSRRTRACCRSNNVGACRVAHVTDQRLCHDYRQRDSKRESGTSG
jgi:hypothetical protein